MLPWLQIAIQTLRANPIRTLLSTLGVVVGAAALVAVLSLGDGAEAFARQQIERRGMQAISVTARTSETVDGMTVPRESYPIFGVAHAVDLSRALMTGSTVALTVDGTGTFVPRAEGSSRAAMVTGIFGLPSALNVQLAHGRFLSDPEMAAGARAVVISNRLANELRGTEDVSTLLGTSLNLQGGSWTIVGILASYPGERLFTVFVPFAAASHAMVPAASVRPPSILIRAPRIEDVIKVRTQAEQWADRVDARWRAERQVAISTTGLDRLRQLNQGIMIFRILIGAFTAISLVVGGIGIMNVLLASVVERTREIGVRRATGAKRRDIALQFLAESVVISLSGAGVGAVVGIGAAFVTAAIMRSQAGAQVYAAATWQTLSISFGAAVSIGLIFGMYPAIKAARMSPIDAVRYE